MNTLQLPFGLSEAIPADAKVAWGARLIVTQDGGVDLPPDRQGLDGDADLRLDLLDRMERVCSLRELFTIIRNRLLDGSLHTRQEGQMVLVDEGGIRIVGDTKASAGYLYLAAFPTAA